MSTIYKNKNVKEELMLLYEQKLKSLNIVFKEIDIDSSFGRTRVIKAGNEKGKQIVLFHGYNAGSPLTLEAVKELTFEYCLFAIDTIGQATKSENTTIDIHDDSFAIWADQVLEKLSITKANIVGISYGAFIVQKLMIHKPAKIAKSILVVPSGIVSGNIWDAITKLSIPLLRFKTTKKEEHLIKFIDAFQPNDDDFISKMLKLIITGVKLDTKIPKLLKRKQVEHFNKPVYIITASNDVYFPSKKIKKRSENLFNDLREVYELKGSKHMPSKKYYTDIQRIVKKWIEE
ncbi:MAG: alpha/beta hydrolase [Bacteroidota bacterium]